jgi:hypothetical protein
MFWHKILRQYLSANTFNQIIRPRISVITVVTLFRPCVASGGRTLRPCNGCDRVWQQHVELAQAQFRLLTCVAWGLLVCIVWAAGCQWVYSAVWKRPGARDCSCVWTCTESTVGACSAALPGIVVYIWVVELQWWLYWTYLQPVGVGQAALQRV